MNQLNLVLSKSLLPNSVNCLHLLQMFMSGLCQVCGPISYCFLIKFVSLPTGFVSDRECRVYSSI